MLQMDLTMTAYCDEQAANTAVSSFLFDLIQEKRLQDEDDVVIINDNARHKLLLANVRTSLRSDKEVNRWNNSCAKESSNTANMNIITSNIRQSGDSSTTRSSNSSNMDRPQKLKRAVASDSFLLKMPKRQISPSGRRSSMNSSTNNAIWETSKLIDFKKKTLDIVLGEQNADNLSPPPSHDRGNDPTNGGSLLEKSSLGGSPTMSLIQRKNRTKKSTKSLQVKASKLGLNI